MLQKSYKDENTAVTHLLCQPYSKRCQGKEQMCVLGYYLDSFLVIIKIFLCSRPYVIKYIYIPNSQIRTQINPAKIILKTSTKNSSKYKFLNCFTELPMC